MVPPRERAEAVQARFGSQHLPGMPRWESFADLVGLKETKSKGADDASSLSAQQRRQHHADSNFAAGRTCSTSCQMGHDKILEDKEGHLQRSPARKRPISSKATGNKPPAVPHGGKSFPSLAISEETHG